MSDATIKLPGVGPVKKQYVYIGGAVVLALAIYTVRKRQAAAAAAAADTTASTTDTTTIDPATGYAQGSAEDLAALQQQNTASYLASTGTVDTSGSTVTSSTGTTSTSYASNGAWAQAAESYLTSTTGADAATVAAALGKYVTGQQVTEAQQSVVEQAIAFGGYPPISAPDGYPPSIRPTPAAPTTPAPKVPTGLRQVSPTTKTSFTAAWNVLPFSGYYIYVNGHRSTEQLEGNLWTINSGHAGIPIKENTAYSVQVTGVNAAGVESAKSAAVTMRTAK